ncbi:MAG: hypothetical protein AB7O32_00050 [Vicinamibacterales bacterium]
MDLALVEHQAVERDGGAMNEELPRILRAAYEAFGFPPRIANDRGPRGKLRHAGQDARMLYVYLARTRTLRSYAEIRNAVTGDPSYSASGFIDNFRRARRCLDRDASVPTRGGPRPFRLLVEAAAIRLDRGEAA